MKRLSIVAAALLIVIGALADRLILGAGSQPSATPAAVAASGSSRAVSSVSANAIDQATIDAYNTARKSIVYINNQGVGTGSGIIYDTQGDIVTNHHVVSGGSGLSVTLSNGKTYSATVVGN